MSSRLPCSAFTPKMSSMTPPRAITAAEIQKAIATVPRSPEAIIRLNSSGPVIPPMAVPTA